MKVVDVCTVFQSVDHTPTVLEPTEINPSFMQTNQCEYNCLLKTMWTKLVLKIKSLAFSEIYLEQYSGIKIQPGCFRGENHVFMPLF